ncbi:MAG: ParA family protein [Phycisphaeraceae bacterium]|nr:ParA family protein [Phycisphaeraceae bacterium]
MNGTDAQSSGGPARIIALMNQKGGVGKTTTTVNLAAAFADQRRRTLVIDLDPQAHASLHLGVDPASVQSSVYDLLIDPRSDPRTAVRDLSSGLALVPSETDLAGAETELSQAHDRHARLRTALSALSSDYDIVLIDCPPSLGVLTINALVAATDVLIPMQAQFLALQGVSKLLETVSLIRADLNPRLRVLGVTLCMFDSQTTHAQEVVADLDGFFESQRELDTPWSRARVFQPPVRRNIKVAECPSFGKTIFEYSPWAAGAKDYRDLAADLLSALDRPPQDAGSTDQPTPEIHVRAREGTALERTG